MVLERLRGANRSTLLRNHILNSLGIEADLGYKKRSSRRCGVIKGVEWNPYEVGDVRLFFRITNSTGGLRLNMANYDLYMRDQLRA